MWDEIDPQDYEAVWPADEDFMNWVEEHSQWMREQEEAEFQARVAALNAELREITAAR